MADAARGGGRVIAGARGRALSDTPDQWSAGADLVAALGYVRPPGAPPRPITRAVIDLGARAAFDRLGPEVWSAIAGVCARVPTPLTFGECCRVVLVEWAFEETSGSRKRRLIAGDPSCLTTLLIAFSHECLRRAGRAERRELLAAIAARAAAEDAR